MITKIRTQAQYDQVMVLIESYLQKATQNGGFKALTEAENQELKQLSVLAEHYEDDVLKVMPLTPSIATIVQQKLRERQLNQRSLSTLIGIGTAKISQILNGKRQPDVQFLKAIHEKLGIDGNVLLEMV
jgi:HTH-type transcriptional regulator / antitoxin HigA